MKTMWRHSKTNGDGQRRKRGGEAEGERKGKKLISRWWNISHSRPIRLWFGSKSNTTFVCFTDYFWNCYSCYTCRNNKRRENYKIKTGNFEPETKNHDKSTTMSNIRLQTHTLLCYFDGRSSLKLNLYPPFTQMFTCMWSEGWIKHSL